MNIKKALSILFKPLGTKPPNILELIILLALFQARPAKWFDSGINFIIGMVALFAVAHIEKLYFSKNNSNDGYNQ